MKDYSFSVKVSDLLGHSGAHDSLKFENKFSDRIDGLDPSGISVDIELHNLNKEEVLVKLPHASCFVDRFCTRCGKPFSFELSFTNKEIIAKVGVDDPTEDLLCIDEKNETIDLESPICDFLLLDEPIKVLCSSCEKIDLDFEDENEGPLQEVKRL